MKTATTPAKSAQSTRPGWKYPPNGLPKVSPNRKVRIRSVLSQIYGISDISDMAKK